MDAAIYNEIEPYAAEWMENLINAGHIATGKVDRRSIRELQPADVSGPGQRHFFAGVGVWSHALRLAGWPDDLGIWTGSCPCQPFSDAGKRGGVTDDRHLWPEWFRLIRKCRPAVVAGEQVASKDGLAWLDAVRTDLEGAGYSFGASDLCAASVGAPHIRQRLYFVAYANEAGLVQQWGARLRAVRLAPRRDDADRRSADGERVADAERGGRESGRHLLARADEPDAGGRGQDGELADHEGDRRIEGRRHERERPGSATDRQLGDPASVGRSPGRDLDPLGFGPAVIVPAGDGELGDACGEGGGRDARAVPGAQGARGGERRIAGDLADQPVHAGAADCGVADADIAHALDGGEPRGRGLVQPEAHQAAVRTPWIPCDWIPCSDGKARPVEPGTFPLAHGAPARVGRLRAYGNAIVAEVAATFLEAVIDVLTEVAA